MATKCWRYRLKKAGRFGMKGEQWLVLSVRVNNQILNFSLAFTGILITLLF